MLQIELIYDHDCPNVSLTREQLKKALDSVNLKPKWVEWERSDKNAPQYVLQYSSPTILINGHPIGVLKEEDSPRSCRIYVGEEGKFHQIPSKEKIQSAIENEMIKTQRLGILGFITASVTSLIVFLPLLVCPLCWPAYTAFLLSFGLSFINYTPILLPIMVIMIILILGLNVLTLKYHKQYWIFGILLLSAISILIFKFYLTNNIFVYFGITGLLIGSFINILNLKKGVT